MTNNYVATLLCTLSLACGSSQPEASAPPPAPVAPPTASAPLDEPTAAASTDACEDLGDDLSLIVEVRASDYVVSDTAGFRSVEGTKAELLQRLRDMRVLAPRNREIFVFDRAELDDPALRDAAVASATEAGYTEVRHCASAGGDQASLPASALGGVSEEQGFGGLGLRGTGRGGGGTGEGTIGLGNLGNIGQGNGGGTGSGYGRRSGQPIPRVTGQVDPSVQNLSPEVIRRVFRRHVNEVRFCYEQQLPANPSLTGQLVVSFVISPTGDVVTAVTSDSTLNNPALESCVASTYRRWAFPRPDGGAISTVRMTLNLSIRR